MRALRCAAAVVLAFVTLHATPAPAAGDGLKAAYLRHFAQFVVWPQNVLPAGAPIVIGLVGDDPFGRAVDEVLAGKHANGHALIVRRLRWNDALTGCHILFVSSSELEHLGAILAATRGLPVLTVSDFDRFTERGGMIELTAAEDRVRFDINTEAVAGAHLRISSKLLQVARAVRGTVEEQ